MSKLQKQIVFFGLCLVNFMVLLSFGMLNMILPLIQTYYEASYTSMQWVMGSFVLALAGFMALFKQIGTQYGQKKMLIIGMVVYLIASFFAWYARGLPCLAVCNAFQGLGVACIMPISTLLIAELFGEKAHRAEKIWYFVGGVGLALGPIIGGIIAQAYMWQSIYFTLGVIGLIGALIFAFALRETRKEASKNMQLKAILLYWIGLAGIVTALIQSPIWGLKAFSTILTFLIGVAALLLYALNEGIKNHVFKFLKERTYFSACVAGFALFFIVWAMVFLVSFYLQQVKMLSIFRAGAFVLCMTVFATMITPYLRRHVKSTSPRKMLCAGFLFLTISLFLASRFDEQTTYGFIALSLLIFGFGWGLVFAPMKEISHLGHADTKVASAKWMQISLRHIGGVLGLAATGSVFFSFYRSELYHASVGQALSSQSREFMMKMVSNPSKMQELLSNVLNEDSQKVLGMFKLAFSSAFSSAMHLLFFVSFVALILVYVLMDRKKHPSE